MECRWLSKSSTDAETCIFDTVQESQGSFSSPLFSRAGLGFEFHKLFGHLITRSLREDAHDGEARVVDVYQCAQRTPARAAGPRGDVSQLNDGNADHAVSAAETVVLHTHLKLVTIRPVLVSKNTTQTKRFLIFYLLNFIPHTFTT